MEKLRFFLVDDDRIFIKRLSRILDPIAQEVISTTTATDAVSSILETRPDCVLLDLMMPGADGLQILKQLRSYESLQSLTIIMVTAKAYEFDRNRALSLGANGYITKPIQTDGIVDEIIRIIEDRIEMVFWGVRGTLPVPGPRAIRYGGNTSCLSLTFPNGHFFIFDAGTGIKNLSDHLMDAGRFPMEAQIFISHPHWDHINGLPFFVPLYVQGNEIQICGPVHGDTTMRELIAGQMDGVYFPINIKEFSARVYFRDLIEERFAIDNIQVGTMLLNHPGQCLGYRINYKDRAICYITDNELFPADSPYHNAHYLEQLIAFVRDADALVADCTYTQEEYERKTGWGHSTVEETARLSHRAGVKTLYMFHHDPDQSDDDILSKEQRARQVLKDIGSSTQCVAPREKDGFKI
jgi:phosphoribosyl 1,2-cyclic phosphodiesterase/ActR/RegA family two-component response regulator